MDMRERKPGILGNRKIMRTVADRFKDVDGAIRCVNCGQLYANWHHIVPISVGGNDVASNLVPLCAQCHEIIHQMRSKREISLKNPWGKLGGAPRRLPDNYKDLLRKFIFSEIGRTELSELWGVSVKARGKDEQKPLDFVHLTERSWYREYLDELGIEKVRNRVDLILGRCGKIKPGDWIGSIVYKNGKKEKLVYKEQEV